MEKQIVTLVTLLFIPVFVWCQHTTKAPCTDEMIQNTKGKWIIRHENIGNISLAKKQETYKRIDIVHNILLKMYPDPVGVDIRMYRSAGVSYYGATRKYRFTEDNTLTFDYVKVLPIVAYSYFANFSPHYCSRSEKESLFMEGVTNENSDGIGIVMNDLSGLAGDPAPDDDWLINGLPVRMFTTRVNEKWKGYEVYGDIRLRGRSIIIHREGMLPYIPVTRKQYLDRCIVVTTKLFDSMIGFAKQTPVRSLEEQEAEKRAKLAKFEKDFGKDPKRLKSAVDYYLSSYKTDQQVRDENIAGAKKHKEEQLKRFKDEMEKATSQAQLDAPAYIRVKYNPDMIFDNDPQTGSMLVTDNPDYFRKDIQGYVPQFLVLNWKWSEYPPHNNYQKLFLLDFPLEKLKAMIDR